MRPCMKSPPTRTTYTLCSSPHTHMRMQIASGVRNLMRRDGAVASAASDSPFSVVSVSASSVRTVTRPVSSTRSANPADTAASSKPTQRV